MPAAGHEKRGPRLLPLKSAAIVPVLFFSLARKGKRGPRLLPLESAAIVPALLLSAGAKREKGRRPTLARAGPALPSAMGRLTSVFGMGTGMTASPWPPARKWAGQSGTKENYNPARCQEALFPTLR